ncbi:P-loop containing nucleoside triphosphate hydrolase protein, partial [Caulochytrium protostelioides]
VIGNGVVIHLPSFFAEIDKLQAQGIDVSERMRVSDRAHLVFDFHQTVDGLKEAELGNAQVGTTRKGIGPAYANKASRSGLRVHHLFQRNDFRQRLVRAVASRQKRYGPFEYDVEAEIARYEAYAERLRPMVTDVVPLISDAVRDPAQQILVEGANALLLDIDYGTYPFVTSSNTTVGGVFTGLGVPPSALKRSIGVVKAYTTRVGSGPFPTELVDAVGEHLTDVGHEYGTTTGRKRR